MEISYKGQEKIARCQIHFPDSFFKKNQIPLISKTWYMNVKLKHNGTSSNELPINSKLDIFFLKINVFFLLSIGIHELTNRFLLNCLLHLNTFLNVFFFTVT